MLFWLSDGFKKLVLLSENRGAECIKCEVLLGTCVMHKLVNRINKMFFFIESLPISIAKKRLLIE